MPTDPFTATFGVEIECHLPEGGSMAALGIAVTARLNAGRHCRPETYAAHRGRTAPYWKITTDGSLGDIRGIELVSPILTGIEGIEETEKVARALVDFGCTVSKKCGLHVHVGVANARVAGDTTLSTSGAPMPFLKRLTNFYAAFEPVLDSVMPRSRRNSNNGFCRSVTTASPTAVNASYDISSLAAAIGNGRYSKLNVNSYAKYKTVEFRHHAGTLDASKIRFWIKTCLRMVAAIKDGAEIRVGSGQPQSTAPAAPAVLVNRARPNSASWTIGNMMLRPEGVTGPEARAAVGWPSVSMPQQAEICGLTVTTQRIGRTVRYFARAAQAEVAAQAAAAPVPITPPTPITLLSFLNIIGSDTAECSYLLQRQADLGGSIEWAA